MIDGHRPRITPSITHPPAGPADATADLITPEDQARNDQLNNTTSSIVLPNAENFPDLFGSTSGPRFKISPDIWTMMKIKLLQNVDLLNC